MLGVVGLSLWQHYRIAFGDVIVIVSLYFPHIVNFISSCLVIKLTFACHLVVVKWFTLSIRHVCTIFHALQWAFYRLLRRYHVTNKSVVSFGGCEHDVSKLIKKFCKKKKANKAIGPIRFFFHGLGSVLANFCSIIALHRRLRPQYERESNPNCLTKT